MVIYFADRYGKILTKASTKLPNNRSILEEKITDELKSGVKIFECTLLADKEIKEYATVGNYVLVKGSLFSIVRRTYFTQNGTIELYCEDAGLDLINRVCGHIAKSTKTLKEWVNLTVGTSAVSGWKYVYNIANTSKELEYTSEATALSRLKDILSNYNADFYFSYKINGMNVIERAIHFVKHRGNTEKEHMLYLNKEVLAITEQQSVEELSTVWKVYGADNKTLENLTGYSTATKTFDQNGHHYEVAGSEVRCTDAMNKWRSKLDTDGRIQRIVYTNYLTAAAAISYAIRNMKVDPAYTYQVEMLRLPKDIECGDYVTIIDTSDKISFRARVTSYIDSDTDTCEIVLN